MESKKDRRAVMSKISTAKKIKALPYPWTVRFYKDRIVIEIVRKRISVKSKPSSGAPPDCRPELW
jgi:hypothetical protein